MFASAFCHSSIARYVGAGGCTRRATRPHPAAVPLESDVKQWQVEMEEKRLAQTQDGR